MLSPTGGIRPPDRRRAARALSLGEREEVSRELSTRCSLRGIARLLGRSPSTVSREVLRNGRLISSTLNQSFPGLSRSDLEGLMSGEPFSPQAFEASGGAQIVRQLVAAGRIAAITPPSSPVSPRNSSSWSG
ncbi:helix-turn-helix domain-containing protein [Brevundimonas sp.]|uniref:helix-turn-helix domain-containing protein n=1 Tax=Brevundimonas sp. TaxID=1871086 RepID=UPI00351CBA17